MKYYAFISGLWAFVAVITLGTALLFIGFGETRNALFACSVSLCAVFLYLMYGSLGKPTSWSGRYCD